MSLRELHTDVQGSLLKGDSFVYAHLLKFERVIKTQSAKPSESATDYSYVTDASVDISWDDGSKDVSDNSNGTQTYIANRLLKVGGINETTDGGYPLDVGCSPKARPTSLLACATLVNESIINRTFLPLLLKYSAIAVALFAALILNNGELSAGSATITVLFFVEEEKTWLTKFPTSLPLSPINPTTTTSASVYFVIIPSKIDLPTPDPAIIPNLWP